MEPLFLQPVFKERIWGGTALKEVFDYDIPSSKTGECWAISAHPNGPSIVKNGPLSGKTLDELWQDYPEIFSDTPIKQQENFPLLTKILDASMDLSVQVHPDDTYAQIHENGELGKTECWYIIDCEEDAEIVYGHSAQSSEELKQFIKEGKWSSLLNRVKIQTGDFFYVPSGTIHALCKGTLVLETQQSSDTTYRVYDYERRDDAGKLRELHLEKATTVTTVPYKASKVTPKIDSQGDSEITTFVESLFFTVYKWDINGTKKNEKLDTYLLCSVIKGEGVLKCQDKTYPFEKGSHFIIPIQLRDFEIEGTCELIVSHP